MNKILLASVVSVNILLSDNIVINKDWGLYGSSYFIDKSKFKKSKVFNYRNNSWNINGNINSNNGFWVNNKDKEYTIIIDSKKDNIDSNVDMRNDINFKTKSNSNSIYDGDTFRVDLPNCNQELFCKSIRIRIKDIDTPELYYSGTRNKNPLGVEAREALVKLIDKKEIELKECERGKYFRVVCDVYVDGLDVGKDLIKNNYAIKYENY